MKEEDLKNSLLLPKTGFPMRAGLATREPIQLQSWEEENLYAKILKNREGEEDFFLHDGPPFANGDAHMGTALNKVLKDFVLKSKTMAGYRVYYLPGWDCHGLPIEYKVSKEKKEGETSFETRQKCREFAKKYVEIQRESFQRLGIFGDWKNAYLTLDADYEASVLRVFGNLVKKKLVYQKKKPVLWSYGARTALAEAEVEYQEKQSPSIYVSFPVLETGNLLLKGAKVLIWTTTPWTLPSNRAVAAHKNLTYLLGNFEREGRGEKFLICQDLVEAFSEKSSWILKEKLAQFSGEELISSTIFLEPPFSSSAVPLFFGNFVTSDSGTGFVHIAPGHGEEDYVLGEEKDLEIFSPVDERGRFTEQVPVKECIGMLVFESNSLLISHLKSLGKIIFEEKFSHSYPHCWRSKTPLIYRAVEQFFISVESLKKKTLEAIDEVNWIPEWGRNRIFSMIENRGDWCISRQRVWGVPLPAFFDAKGNLILSSELIEKVAEWVEKNGTQKWFEERENLSSIFDLPEGTSWCGETLDVWIDSGSSFSAVMEKRLGREKAADLYLEATDQHRGWFQSSLLLSLAIRGRPPYKRVITHGFVVDKETGKKTSKSEGKKKGKPTDAKYYYNRYGADIVRLWASSVDWKNEVPFSEEVFQQVSETYRRWRNTLRALLANINDFSSEDSVDFSLFTGIDSWMLERTNFLGKECSDAYADFDFQRVYRKINEFCTRDLSHLYINVMKDRLYCDSLNSPRRRMTQTAMFYVLKDLCLWMAPILVFTSEEAWKEAGFEGSVHSQKFPEKLSTGFDFSAKMEELLHFRSEIQKRIETSVQSGVLETREQAEIFLSVNSQSLSLEELQDNEFSSEFFQVSSLKVKEGDFFVEIMKTEKEKCPRCWRFVCEKEESLCPRCSDVMKEISE